MHSSYTKHTASSTQARPYFGSTSTRWTQDHHVTSPMSPPTAYDPTTPPSASSFPPQARQQTRSAVPILPVPQQRWPITATPAVLRPPPPLLAPTPQLAHTDSPRSIPRPAPREHHLQGDLYHAFTRDAYLCSGTAAAREVVGSLNFDQNYHHRVAAAAFASTPADPKETVKSQPHYYQQHQHYYYPQQPQQNSKRQHHTLAPPAPRPSKRQKTNKKEELHFVDPSTFATLNAAMMEIASRQIPGLPGASSTPTSKLSFKDATWTFPKKLKKKRRRPSEIFNINFGFGFSSRRRQSSDYSPQVSPRTSISSASGSPRSEMMTESFKRQRIDSTDLDVDVVPSKKSARKEEEQTEDVVTPLSRSSMSSTRCEGGEAHPGQLVDFTLSPPSPTCLPSAASTPQVPTLTLSEPEVSHQHNNNNNTTLPSTEVNLHVSADAYHDYLATTHRRKSFPAGEWAARRVREEFSLLSRLDGNQHSRINEDDEEVDPLDTSATIIATPLPPMVDTNNNKCELRRTTSDPSTERFLTHIRASLEARRNSKSSGWQTYPVFADEGEKGFLDDAPL